MASPVPAKLGPYQVRGVIGAGGMGKVYLARDTRLDRAVAIKVVNEKFSDRARREARAVAALNHPHICQIYDVGPLPEGGEYLVMEYLEGETLAQRLEAGPLPLEQSVAFAIQIADALAAAHRAGIVHRDLKPANIMLAKSGVKLLDFGLARLDRRASDDTLTGLTGPGTVLGTLPYMAPEQLEGKKTDARTDLFAFGALLFEMVTGRRAFTANSEAQLISAIMSSEPPAVMPPALDRVVRSCIAKHPDDRWQSAHDVQLALGGLADAAATPAAHPRPGYRELAWGIGLVLLLAAALLAVFGFRGGSQPGAMVRSSILPPSGWSFEPGSFAVSPNGNRLAFAAFAPDGRKTLWVRTLSGSGAQQLAGTEGALAPFRSPDSLRIGFFGGERLKTVDAGTGAVRILSETPRGRLGGAWNSDGTIVFAPSMAGPLYRIGESGGVPVPVTSIWRIRRATASMRVRWTEQRRSGFPRSSREMSPTLPDTCFSDGTAASGRNRLTRSGSS